MIAGFGHFDRWSLLMLFMGLVTCMLGSHYSTPLSSLDMKMALSNLAYTILCSSECILSSYCHFRRRF